MKLTKANDINEKNRSRHIVRHACLTQAIVSNVGFYIMLE